MFRTVLSVGAILLAATTAVSAQETTTEPATEEAQSDEAIAWASVKNSAASADVFAFIERYPNSEFTKEAQALMIDLLWAEMAADSPVQEAETDQPIVQDTVAVTFSVPLTH